MTNKTRFSCNNCSYRFNRNNKPQLCPMCGKQNVMEDMSRGAQDFIDEVQENKRITR